MKKITNPYHTDSAHTAFEVGAEAQRLHTLSLLDPETPEGKVVKAKIDGAVSQWRFERGDEAVLADSILAIVREAI